MRPGSAFRSVGDARAAGRAWHRACSGRFRMDFAGPRERLLAKGATSLSDLELLAVLLGTGPSPSTESLGACELARALLVRFGGLSETLRAAPEELSAVRGVGPSKLARLVAVREASLRLWTASEEIPAIESAESAYRLFSDLALEEQETVAAAFLNTKHRLIRKVIVFRGLLDATVARPREILREALRANAAKILVAHNHPSGNPEPSREDDRFTEQMEVAARAVGIPLLDHLVICRDGRYFSFRSALTPTSPSSRCGAEPRPGARD